MKTSLSRTFSSCREARASADSDEEKKKKKRVLVKARADRVQMKSLVKA